MVQKISLSSSRDIPFNKLVLAQANVRTVKAGESIEALAESIARHGLIQSLHVRPVLDADGAETGMFEVPAGGRRYRALELLVKQKRLAKAAPIPCVIGDAKSEVLIEEVSLAENIDRAPLHPLDQFKAFQAMRDKGMGEEAIAAAFMVSPTVVKQRLRLASVSPKLLQIYGEDQISLEQLMAFTVSQDHARQEQVWDTIRQGFQKDAWHIKRLLNETCVKATDKRALFVGIEAYKSAGGAISRDLFTEDQGGWLQDVALLDGLATQKLKLAAEYIAQEGWKWVEAALALPFDHAHGLKRIKGTPAPILETEQAAYDALLEEYNTLSSSYEGAEELPDDVDERLGELETAMEALDQRPMCFDPLELAASGAFVSIDPQGKLSVDRGLMRLEDAQAHQQQSEASRGTSLTAEQDQRSVHIAPIGSAAEVEDDEDGIKPLPERLVIELSAFRSLALRDAVAQEPHVAMTLLLHKMVCDLFQTNFQSKAIEANFKKVGFPIAANDLNDCTLTRSVETRHQSWAVRIPTDDELCWDWLNALDDTSRADLLAHCVSYGINALHERVNPFGAGLSASGLQARMHQTDRLARMTNLDLVQAGWRPSADNYLGRVTKAQILQAVREGAGERQAQLIEHLKKGDMAKEAERLLDTSGWLPEPLRLIEIDAEQSGEAMDEADALPAFLDDEDSEDEPHLMAAE